MSKTKSLDEGMIHREIVLLRQLMRDHNSLRPNDFIPKKPLRLPSPRLLSKRFIKAAEEHLLQIKAYNMTRTMENQASLLKNKHVEDIKATRPNADGIITHRLFSTDAATTIKRQEFVSSETRRLTEDMDTQERVIWERSYERFSQKREQDRISRRQHDSGLVPELLPTKQSTTTLSTTSAEQSIKPETAMPSTASPQPSALFTPRLTFQAIVAQRRATEKAGERFMRPIFRYRSWTSGSSTTTSIPLERAFEPGQILNVLYEELMVEESRIKEPSSKLGQN